MEITAYEKVAGIIGEEMDLAWKNILEKISKGTQESTRSFSLNEEDLKGFISNLSAAQLDIQFFSANKEKGLTKRFSAHELTPPYAFRSGSISVSIGASWSF